MTFDEWWDTSRPAMTPDTFMGWEASCRQAWYAARKHEPESSTEAELLAALKQQQSEIVQLRAAIEEAMPFQMTIGAEILCKALGPNVRAKPAPTAKET